MRQQAEAEQQEIPKTPQEDEGSAELYHVEEQLQMLRELSQQTAKAQLTDNSDEPAMDFPAVLHQQIKDQKDLSDIIKHASVNVSKKRVSHDSMAHNDEEVVGGGSPPNNKQTKRKFQHNLTSTTRSPAGVRSKSPKSRIPEEPRNESIIA